jgi:hypothetical protein
VEATVTITPTPTQSVLPKLDWIKTDDVGLINYAAPAPKDTDNSIWPIYKSWTLSDTTYTDMSAPNDVEGVVKANAKTYMKYQTLGYSDWNRQGHLSRQKSAYTGNHYVRMLDGRMLIALAQYYSTTIGQYIDIELEDGTILACMLGDAKANIDTDETKRYCTHDFSVIEFVVDSQGLDSSDYSRIKALDPIAGGGNFSNIPELSSPVKNIRVYNKVYPIDMKDLSNDNPDTYDKRR